MNGARKVTFLCWCHVTVSLIDIEAQIEDIQARRRAAGEQAEQNGGDRVGLNSLGHYDMNVYTSGDKSGYVTSIPANEDDVSSFKKL